MMKNVILRATKDLQHIFDWSWRLAILALPWQTRWFSDAWLAGWPWEQGRLSFYASWIPMLVVIVLSFRHSLGGYRENDKRRMVFVFLLISVLVDISILTILRDSFRDFASFRPILQWWAQVGILALFIRALWRVNISSRSIASWFVISTVPHALLGIWQFASQEIIGSKWLGIASQLPQTLGVSVVAHDGLRILRAYGGFPHPNIFGGWLVLGALVAVWLAMTSTKRRDTFLWLAGASVFMSTLAFTFARAAWIAAAIGFVALFIREKKIRPILFIPFLVFAFTLFTQRQHVFARFDVTQRLEQKSIAERVGSLREGIDLFWSNPMIGNGVNAELLESSGYGLYDTARTEAPLEPPHNVFLLALDDVGIIGFAAILTLLILFVRAYGCTPSDRKAHIHAPVHSLFAILFILALFDHYLWSTWSGQALVAIVFFLSRQPQTDS